MPMCFVWYILHADDNERNIPSVNILNVKIKIRNVKKKTTQIELLGMGTTILETKNMQKEIKID